MSICGFNETMEEGLKILFKGMILALENRALREKCSFRKVLELEIEEIPIINEKLSSADSVELKMFKGINLLALPLFKEASTLDSSPESVEKIYSSFIEVLKKTEEYNLSHIANKEVSLQDKANELGSWVIENN